MNTLEVFKYLEVFPQFQGVYPRDHLPNSVNNNCGIILNTDVSQEPGEHWVSIYKTKDSAIYFDSYGLVPLHNEIINCLDSISPLGWYINTVCFQSLLGDSCGMYCIFFLECMFKYNDFNKFRSIFNAKPYWNDILSKTIYKIQTRNQK